MKKVLLMAALASSFAFAAEAQNAKTKASKAVPATYQAAETAVRPETAAKPEVAQENKGGAKRTPEERAENMTKRMTKKLKLDAAQIEKVKAINLSSAKNIEEVKVAAKDDRKAASGRIEKIEADREASLKSVLKEDQMKAYIEMRDKQKAKMVDKKGKRKGTKAAETAIDADDQE